MGGEQWPVLVYGSKQCHTLVEWIDRFELIDKKKWVKNFLENDKHTYEEGYDTDDEEGIEIVFDQECEGYDMITVLENFLGEQGLSAVYFSNFCWDEFSIGLEVKEYNDVKSEDKERVRLFCGKYNLSEPTFYAGIMGELE